MADCIIVCWRDIPAQVLLKEGRKSVKAILPELFEQSIDMAAMRAGLKDSDSYLQHWNKKVLCKIDDFTQEKADFIASKLTDYFTGERIKQLIAAGGEDKSDLWDSVQAQSD